jgi:hypothetical protein
VDLSIISKIASAVTELVKDIISKYGFAVPTLILAFLFLLLAFSSVMTENLRLRRVLFSLAVLIMLLAFIWFLAYGILTIPILAG